MKTRRDEPERIGPLLEGILAEKGYLTVCKEYRIVQQWPAIVDSSFAEATTCERVENGIMYVRVRSSPWRQEAVYNKEKILNRIHREFGCPTIKDIVFY